ncbi:hypothetical protein PI87_14345 [Ralstonia sp. A12]|uniref:DUF6714 family protein n=1 Tax=Ralstonia sp. A12 TaxID=1217052 RepID=UPI000575C8DA|nr:DUF6714 family protein [Ralstonia sp. A12]KHK54782.1 hypothetical protein PI87_14345 [Ralstonia sp. A12]
MDKGKLEESIANAFVNVKTPPDWALVRSREGSEPAEIEAIFRGVKDWRNLHVFKMDQDAVLSFLSDEAFRYYIQAFMLYDIRGEIHYNDVVFHLVHGLEGHGASKRINPRRYGDRTGWDSAIYRHSVFSKAQAGAIVEYLKFKLEAEGPDGFDALSIQQALANYWLERAESSVE